MTAGTGQPERDSRDGTGIGQLGYMYSRDRKAGAEQPGQDSRDRTAGTGQPGQDSRDRIAGTGQSG
jgi:hypothetical protein